MSKQFNVFSCDLSCHCDVDALLVGVLEFIEDGPQNVMVYNDSLLVTGFLSEELRKQNRKLKSQSVEIPVNTLEIVDDIDAEMDSFFMMTVLEASLDQFAANGEGSLITPFLLDDLSRRPQFGKDNLA
jgi:hypothetical protein